MKIKCVDVITGDGELRQQITIIYDDGSVKVYTVSMLEGEYALFNAQNERILK